MSDITVRGNPWTVRLQLAKLDLLFKELKTFGFELFQPDEEWRYEIEVDPRPAEVCPICLGNYGVGRFSGSQIPSLFSFYERRLNEGSAVVHPKVHLMHPHLKGDCRCRLYMENIVNTLLNRLHDMKMEMLA